MNCRAIGPLLGQAVLTHIARELGRPGDAYRCHVVEDERQILIHHGAQQSGDYVLDVLLVISERVHGTQQLLVRQCLAIDLGQAHRLEPAQHAQLRVWIAQAIEDHDAYRMLHGCRVARAAKGSCKLVEADLLPEFRERPHVAQRQRGLEGHLRSRDSSIRQPDFGMWWNTSIFQRSAYQRSFSTASVRVRTGKSVTSFQSIGS